MPNMNAWTERDDEVVRKMNADGCTNSQISNRLGRSVASIGARIKKLGLKTNRDISLEGIHNKLKATAPASTYFVIDAEALAKAPTKPKRKQKPRKKTSK